jgi:lipid-A-disaccharide synthase
VRLFAVAGEASGDRILAALLAGLRARDPGLEARGLGGPLSAAQGLESIASLAPIETLAVNGISDVLRRGVSLWRARATLLRALETFRPDRVLLVDYPGMNVPLARRARALGIPVHYVAPPQLWAYKDPSARLRRLRAAFGGAGGASLQALFPVEAAAYAPWDPEIRQGHFFAQPSPEFAPDMPRGDRLLLCPGSRAGVLRRNLPLWLARLRAGGVAMNTVDILVPDFLAAEARAIVAAGSHGRGMPRPYELVILTDRDIAFSRARAAIAFPGTITLELLLRRIPAHVWAVLDAPTFWIGRSRLRGPHVALANVMAGREAFPEWIGTAGEFRRHPPRIPEDREVVSSTDIVAIWNRMGSDRGVAVGVAAVWDGGSDREPRAIDRGAGEQSHAGLESNQEPAV